MKSNLVELMSNGDMSGDLKSIGLDLNQVVLYSIQAVWTGDAVGSINLEVSNDIVDVAASNTNPVGLNPAANVVNWSTYTGSEHAITSEGNFLWNVLEAGYKWVRVSYTHTSGTGSLQLSFSGKGV